MQNTTLTRSITIILLAGMMSASLRGQTTPPPAKATTHKPSAAGTASTAMKLPPNIPAVPGFPKTLFALKYIDIKLGTGELAQPDWKYTVHYTGWLHDGTKFDSSVDRGAPIDFFQGAHRVILGWDDGFDGMRVGGKRRLFIPWQLAYGEAGRGKIPPKADLIFDIELIAQSDPNAPQPTPGAPATPPTTQAAPIPKPATSQ
jgi:peptidylprolyl isomerase